MENDFAKLMSTHVDDLDLPVRARNCLRRANATQVRELVHKTRAQLLALRGMGLKTVSEIDRVLGAFGLRLGMWVEDPMDNVVRQFHDKRIGVRDVLSMHVGELPLAVRAYNCLKKKNISRVVDLVRKTPAELLAIRNMGVTSLDEVRRILAFFGLRLGMSSHDVSTVIDTHSKDSRDCDAFLEVMELLGRSGVGRAADVTRMTSDDVLAVPGLDSDRLAVLENGLRQWGLGLRPVRQEDADLGIIEKPTGFLHTAGRSVDADSKRPETVRDELTIALTRLLEDVKGVSPQGFLAYHGIDGAPVRTLREIGEAGIRYGFSRPVTRERVRQVLKRTEHRLKARSRRMQFVLWETTVERTRRRLPASSQAFARWFGYGTSPDSERVFTMLRFCAGVLGLEFPFDLRDSSELGSLVVGHGHHADAFLSRLREAVRGPYVELQDLGDRIGLDADFLAAIVDASSRLEFLDDARRYFWKRPSLPPRNFAITGNAILTSLCKVFSATARAASADLVLSIPRDRMFRKAESMAEIPLSALEGIAEKSGLFSVGGGQIVKKAGNEWSVIGQRDVALLAICAEHGRVVPSHLIYSGLMQSGLSRENAATVVAYSPFLVHTQSGIGHKEGVYRFVVGPDEMDLGESKHLR